MKISMLFILALAASLLSACAPAAVPAAPVTIDTGIDPETWALVPAGEFLYGQHNHEQTLDYDFEIMLTDVTVLQYTRFLNEALASDSIKVEGERLLAFYPGDDFHAHEHEIEIKAGDYVVIPLDDPGLRLGLKDGQFISQPGYDNHPMTLVSWFGARAYCDYYGWRLPSEIEWEKAARGIDGRPFPWGEGIHPSQANYYSSYDLFEKTFGKLGGTTPVGFYNGRSYDGYQTQDARSPYGLFDMAGNVWQWTGDVYPGQHYRYMRGGSKDNYEYNLRAWTRNSAGPEYYSPAVGFRCVR